MPLPVTITIHGVDLAKAGTWNSAGGKVTITTADLAAMVTNDRSQVIDLAPIKLGHDDGRFNNADGTPRDGQPSLGRVTNLRLSDDGGTLYGDLVGVPKSLADVVATAYPRRSVEVVWTKEHGAILTGIALLGQAPPAVKGLNDVYKATATGESLTTERVASLTGENADLAEGLRDTGDIPQPGTDPAESADEATQAATSKEQTMTVKKAAASGDAGDDGKTPTEPVPLRSRCWEVSSSLRSRLLPPVRGGLAGLGSVFVSPL